MGNCHSAVAGIGGTARASTKVAILLDLKKAHGVGGTLLDVGCSFGHFMLAALLMGYKGACGCDLPENHVQCTVLKKAKAWLGISPDDLCEWIGSDVRVAALAERLGGFGTCAPGTWSPRASAYGHSWPGPHANRDGRKLGTAIGTPYESRPLTMTPVPRRRSIPGPGRLG